jgi:hypothetical protein
MKYVLFFVLIIGFIVMGSVVSVLAIPSHHWFKTIGTQSDDYGYSVASANFDGYTYIAGILNGSLYIAKLNETGDILWNYVANITLNPDQPVSITVNPSNTSLYVVGTTSDNNIFITKLTTNGTVVWSRIIGGGLNDYGRDVLADANGYVYIVGITWNGLDNTYGDAFLIKLDENGTFYWAYTIGGNSTDTATSVIHDALGNILVIGHTNSFGTNYDLFVASFTPDGSLNWFRTLGTSTYSEYAGKAVLGLDGYVYISGQTYSLHEGAYSYNGLLVKIDPSKNVGSGFVGWGRVFGGTGNDALFDVKYGNNNILLATGYTYSYGDTVNGNIFAVWVDSTGSFITAKSIGGNDTDKGFDLAIDSNGFTYIVGSTKSFGAGGSDIFELLCTTSLGNLSWTGNESWPDVSVEDISSTTMANITLTATQQNITSNDVSNKLTMNNIVITTNTPTPETHIAIDTNTPTPIPEPTMIIIIATAATITIGFIITNIYKRK